MLNTDQPSSPAIECLLDFGDVLHGHGSEKEKNKKYTCTHLLQNLRTAARVRFTGEQVLLFLFLFFGDLMLGDTRARTNAGILTSKRHRGFPVGWQERPMVAHRTCTWRRKKSTHTARRPRANAVSEARSSRNSPATRTANSRLAFLYDTGLLIACFATRERKTARATHRTHGGAHHT